MLTNYKPEYSGIYQSNITFEEELQDQKDQEAWEEDLPSEILQDAFICPGMLEADA